MSDLGPYSFLDNGPPTEGQIMVGSLMDNFNQLSSNTITSQPDNLRAGFGTVLLALPPDPPQPPPISLSHPPLEHSAEVDVFAQLLSNHFELQFPTSGPRVASESNPQPPIIGVVPNVTLPVPGIDPENDIAELQHLLDDAITFIRA